MCFLENLLLILASSGRGFWGQKTSLVGIKKGSTMAAAFILDACYNMYIFTSDGNPSITREGSQIMMVAAMEGAAGKKHV